ncbi:MAG TPA: M24 family metallopeptidase, partial [Pelobium sp.]|nr:M24 family metallopeptidase [Pelobium sp.]
MPKVVFIKSEEEIELIRISSQLVSKTHAEVAKVIGEGVTTKQLNKVAEEFIRDNGAIPAFLNYNGFPYTLCISLNDQVVHGFPSNYELRSGDIVSVDCGVIKNNYFGDSAYTFMIGEVADETRNLLKVTQECLTLAIENAIVGNRVGDIGFACQQHAEKHGYGVVKE